MKEQVLVFPAHLLNGFWFENYIMEGKTAISLLDKILNSTELVFIDREKAEKDPEWKQLIGYNVLKKDKKVFAYRRTKNGGESRLHDKSSIGVGGHTNPIDGESLSPHTFWNSVERELKEEVGLENNFNYKTVALIYDDRTEVSTVHFGVVNIVNVGPDAELSFKDRSLGQGGFESIDTLKKYYDQLEGWSQIVFKEILDK